QASQAGVSDSAELYNNFLATQSGKFGPFVPAMDFLQFFDIFGSFYFRGLLGLLIVSIAGSTVSRWPALSHASFRPRVKLGTRAFDGNPEARHIESELAPEEAAARLQSSFAGRRYRVARADADGATYLYADRNRYAPLGTFLSHTGLILLFAGGLVRSFFGFHTDGFAIPDGSTRPLGFGPAITVQNQGFVEIDDPRTGMPLDFYSDLVLYDNGVEKARQRIRVNEPLSYAGIDFHQAYFGQAAVVRVVDVNGQELYNDGVPLAFKNEVRYGPRAFGFMRLLGGRLLIDIVGGVPNDPDISPGEVVALFYQSGNGEPFATRKLRLGQTESVGGLQLTFQRER